MLIEDGIVVLVQQNMSKGRIKQISTILLTTRHFVTHIGYNGIHVQRLVDRTRSQSIPMKRVGAPLLGNANSQASVT